MTIENLKANLNAKLVNHYSKSQLVDMVLFAGIASDDIVEIIQSRANEVLEDSMSENEYVEFLNDWEIAINNGVDCTLNEFSVRFSV